MKQLCLLLACGLGVAGAQVATDRDRAGLVGPVKTVVIEDVILAERQQGTAVVTFDASGRKLGETPVMVYFDGGYAVLRHDPQFDPQARGKRIVERQSVKVYDAQGYLIEKAESDAQGRRREYRVAYERDPVGNWVKRSVSAAGQPVEVSYRTIVYHGGAAGRGGAPAGSTAAASPNPSAGNPGADARRIYQQNCAACHGPDGKAGTEIAALLDPRPSDLAAPATQGRSDDEIYAAITHGLTGRGMPAYRQRLGDAERRELVAYVRQLPKAAAAAAPPVARAAAPAPDEQRYAFAGRVVSVDPARRQVMIAHEEIKGYMGAMTMAFPLKDERLYQVLKAGDRLRATLVIDGDGWRLDEVVVDR